MPRDRPECGTLRGRATIQRHRIRDGHRVFAKPVLGGLHHEYRVEAIAE